MNTPTAQRRWRNTETKPAWYTTELWVYLAVVLAIIITSLVVGRPANHTGAGAVIQDPFDARTALRDIVWVTIGYMLSRGLAKIGKRPYYDDREYALRHNPDPRVQP